MKMVIILESIFSIDEYFLGYFHSWLVLSTEQARYMKKDISA